MASKKNDKKINGKEAKILMAVGAVICVIGAIGIIVSAVQENRKGKTGSAVTEAAAGDFNVKSAEDLTVSHYAEIDIQDYGKITVALDESRAPETVKNFVELAESGFYDGLKFHRIIEGFMMQGGDPLGNGTGGSEKTITGEFSSNGVENPISHVRGAISMARSQDKNSASSQFFIVHKDSTFLDGEYAAFGFVTEGLDVVDKVCTEVKATDDNGTIDAADMPVMTSVKITAAK